MADNMIEREEEFLVVGKKKIITARNSQLQ